MIFRTQEEIDELQAQVNVSEVLAELLKWRSELEDSQDDNMRLAMIDSFEDVIIDLMKE